MNGRNWSQNRTDLKMHASKHHSHIAYKYTIFIKKTECNNTNSSRWYTDMGYYQWFVVEHFLGLWRWTLTAVILYMLCIMSTSVIQLNFTSISWKLTSCFGPTLQVMWLSDDKQKVEMYKEDVTGGRGGGWEVDDKEKEEEIKVHKEGLRVKKRRINKMSKPLGCGQEVSLSAQISWASVPDWRCHSADLWRTC